jgi:3-methyladenine DNA glycosylase/8-oxoguanine DNA glycosylase
MPLLVPISVAELLDKISILEIKEAAIGDPAKLANVRHELTALAAVRERQVAPLAGLAALYAELKAVNEELWRIEDEIREKERLARFDDGFVALARSVYQNNDRRARVKRQINDLTGSDIVEEKSYV